MENLFESLKEYFENTPINVLNKDWNEIEYLNEIGPDVVEYAESVRERFGVAVQYSNPTDKAGTHKYDISDEISGKNINVDAKYCLAA